VTKAEADAKENEVWDADEVTAQDHGVDDDPRPQPEYDALFKQVVSSEDLYVCSCLTQRQRVAVRSKPMLSHPQPAYDIPRSLNHFLIWFGFW
jgi:hypothetical protein